MNNGKDDVDDDYDFARAKYYNLADKGDEAIELMMELARESEHPRAFEVLSNMMKQNAEIADRLMELQKKKNLKTKLKTTKKKRENSKKPYNGLLMKR